MDNEIQTAANTNTDGGKYKYKWGKIQKEMVANTNTNEGNYKKIWWQIQMSERIIRHEPSGADTISRWSNA